MRIQALAAVGCVAALSTIASAGVTSWTFDTDASGWQKNTSWDPLAPGSDATANWGPSEISVLAQGTQERLYINGLNIQVTSSQDTLALSSGLAMGNPFQWAAYAVFMEYYDGVNSVYKDIELSPASSGSVSVSATYTLVGDFGLDIGDVITRVGIKSFAAGQHNMILDDLTITTAAVPEPATAGILGLAGALALLTRKRA